MKKPAQHAVLWKAERRDKRLTGGKGKKGKRAQGLAGEDISVSFLGMGHLNNKHTQRKSSNCSKNK